VVSTYDNWGGAWKGDSFDPNVDKFFTSYDPIDFSRLRLYWSAARGLSVIQ
jgi:hypothetical protein